VKEMATTLGVSHSQPHERLRGRSGQRRAQGPPRLNPKRIYWLMAQNGMLLSRHAGKPPGRPNEGHIIALRPNPRWTSDGFEIPCWNSEVVRVAFSRDTSSREVMAGRPRPTASAAR